MTTIELDDWAYTFLIKIITNQFYQETDFDEIFKINQLYKQLNYQSETWLSCLPDKKDSKIKKKGTVHGSRI